MARKSRELTKAHNYLLRSKMGAHLTFLLTAVLVDRVSVSGHDGALILVNAGGSWAGNAPEVNNLIKHGYARVTRRTGTWRSNHVMITSLGTEMLAGAVVEYGFDESHKGDYLGWVVAKIDGLDVHGLPSNLPAYCRRHGWYAGNGTCSGCDAGERNAAHSADVDIVDDEALSELRALHARRATLESDDLATPDACDLSAGWRREAEIWARLAEQTSDPLELAAYSHSAEFCAGRAGFRVCENC